MFKQKITNKELKPCLLNCIAINGYSVPLGRNEILHVEILYYQHLACDLLYDISVEIDCIRRYVLPNNTFTIDINKYKMLFASLCYFYKFKHYSYVCSYIICTAIVTYTIQMVDSPLALKQFTIDNWTNSEDYTISKNQPYKFAV